MLYYTFPCLDPHLRLTSSFLAFIGVIVFPIDIGLSTEGTKARTGMVTLWMVIYIATCALAWGVLPIMRDYWRSGEFSGRSCPFKFVIDRERLRESIKCNLRQIVIMGIVIAIVVVYLVLSGTAYVHCPLTPF